MKVLTGQSQENCPSAHNNDCNYLCCKIGESLLPGSTFPKILEKLSQSAVTPGRLKREYRKIYKIARLRALALAHENLQTNKRRTTNDRTRKN